MNKLINGDALVELDKMIAEGVKVDTIVTDPPYGVNFKSHYDDSKEYVFGNIDKWFTQFYKLLKDKSHMFVFVPVKEIHKWIQAGINNGFDFKNIIATRSFNNGSKTPNNSLGSQFQPILHFTKGKGKELNTYDFIPTSKEWFKDKRNKNPKPFTYEYPNWIKTIWAFATAKRSTKKIHPNEKNLDLIKFLIGISTKEQEWVLDPFMGSGTTGIACKELGRNFIGIELDEKYFNIAKERIEEKQ